MGPSLSCAYLLPALREWCSQAEEAMSWTRSRWKLNNADRRSVRQLRWALNSARWFTSGHGYVVVLPSLPFLCPAYRFNAAIQQATWLCSTFIFFNTHGAHSVLTTPSFDSMFASRSRFCFPFYFLPHLHESVCFFQQYYTVYHQSHRHIPFIFNHSTPSDIVFSTREIAERFLSTPFDALALAQCWSRSCILGRWLWVT